MVLALLFLTNGWCKSQMGGYLYCSCHSGNMYNSGKTLLPHNLHVQDNTLRVGFAILMVGEFAMLLCVPQPYSLPFNTNQPITHDTDPIFDFWLHILNLHAKWVLVMYNTWHLDKVSLIPFLVILTIIAVARDIAQISTVPFSQCITCCTPHLIITYWFDKFILHSPPMPILYIFNMADTHWIMKYQILDRMSQN